MLVIHKVYFENQINIFFHFFFSSRPWDPRTDVLQYEYDFKIQTLTRHQPPAVRTGSIISVDDTPKVELIRHLSVDHVLPRSSVCILPKVRHRKSVTSHGSGSSSANGEAFHGSDSTESDSKNSCCRLIKI